MSRGTLLAFLLGAWCAATLFMWFVAVHNFRVVDGILASKNPELAQITEALSDEQRRLMARHQASEVNRLFFDGWGKVQLPLAAVVLLLAWRARLGKFVIAATAAMLVIVVVLQLWVVPETVRLGRIMDFLPRDPAPPESALFWTLHHTYTGLDAVKLLLALASGVWVVRKP